jgi:predicted ATPase
MIIEKVTIKNFRSIEMASFSASDLNVLVGKNDVGKSNFLKALNLFFNNETENGNRFDFDTDYCLFAKTRSKQAKQIEIEIVFNLPETYKEKRKVVWRKVWRRQDSDPIPDVIIYEDRDEIKKRARVITWLQRIRFRYVPAVKSNAYFSSLLRNIYDVLAKTVENDVRSASELFLETIDTHTSNITSDVNYKLGLESSIRLPANLGGLFESLDFQTQRDGKPISLQHRGDGIKIRYIPIILEFLAIQENKNRAQGSIKIDTIWGYEEPENNLEFINAFKLAEEFPEYAKNVQIFLTTHSPAFYALGKQPKMGVNLYSVISENNTSHINLILPEALDGLDEDMGILPLVTPYVNKTIAEYRELYEELEEKIKLLDDDVPTLFVEGPSDELIIKKAFSIFTPDINISIKTDKDGAGHEWVRDLLMAWVLARKKSKSGGLFDKDDAAKKSKSEVAEWINKKGKSQDIKTFALDVPPHLVEILKTKLNIPVTLEEMFPVHIWKVAQENEWLESRGREIVALNNYHQLDISFKAFCQNQGLKDDQLIYVLNKVKKESKKHLANYISDLNDAEAKQALYGFDELTKKLAAHFGVD